MNMFSRVAEFLRSHTEITTRNPYPELVIPAANDTFTRITYNPGRGWLVENVRIVEPIRTLRPMGGCLSPRYVSTNPHFKPYPSTDRQVLELVKNKRVEIVGGNPMINSPLISRIDEFLVIIERSLARPDRPGPTRHAYAEDLKLA